MKLPFIALSYGDFNENKKLFSYENEGVHTLPIFSDPSVAEMFIRGMSRALESVGDTRALVPQVCSDPKHAHSMFVTICTIAPDMNTVAIDPAPPGALDINLAGAGEGAVLIQQKVPIEEIIEDLQVELGMSPPELSLEDNEPTSKQE